jgi:hypothetical protein
MLRKSQFQKNEINHVQTNKKTKISEKNLSEIEFEMGGSSSRISSSSSNAQQDVMPSGCPSVELTDSQAQWLVEKLSVFEARAPYGVMRVAAFCCDANQVSTVSFKSDPNVPRKLTIVTKKTATGTKFYLVDMDPLYLPISFLYASCDRNASVHSTNWSDIVGMRDLIRCIAQSEDAGGSHTKMNLPTPTPGVQAEMQCEEVSVELMKKIIQQLYKNGYHLKQIVIDKDSMRWKSTSAIQNPDASELQVGCRTSGGESGGGSSGGSIGEYEDYRKRMIGCRGYLVDPDDN